MEHYLLCILNSSLSEKDHSLIKKYLYSLFPSPFQNYHIQNFHESVSILLEPISKYVAVLNACETNDNLTWKLLNEDASILNIIEDETTKTDSAVEFDSQDSNDYICESLHSLADQLPAFGTYKLDILLGSAVLRELSVSKEPSLAGVFIRLTRWHSADFTIFEQQEFDTDRLNEWLEIINGKILHLDKICDLGPCLWRGSIQFSSEDNKREMYSGFQLKLSVDENSSSSAAKQDTYHHHHSEHIIISSKLELLKEVSFASIPSYLITPVTFRLYLNKLNTVNVNSSNLIEYLLKNKTALIAQLGYNVLKERTKPERKYSLRAWEKAASTNDVKDSECFVSSFEKFITFAITKSHFSSHIVAYPLRDSTNIDATFFYMLLNHRISYAYQLVPELKSKIEVSLDNNAKHKNALHKYSKSCVNSKHGHCSCNNINFSFLTKTNQNLPSCSEFADRNSLKFSAEQLDPSDWPERIQLLQKQMQKDEEKNGFSTNASVVQNLKLPHQTYSLSSQTITEYFLPSGESKNSENCENINLNSNSHYIVKCNRNDVLRMEWPEVINCIYHDLYYNNSDQMEDKENIGSQLINLYVQHETACTCSNQQMIQNFQITISERIQSPSKAFRGPSSRLAVISNETSPSPRKNNLRDLITKKILSTSTSQVKNSDEPRKTLKETSKINSEVTNKRNSANKNLVPVRCSPRKKNPVNYKDFSVNRNNENKNAESNKMADLLRKKLRCAVAKALEDNGISGTHKLYQPCGAKLLTICRTFLDDLKLKKGKTSEYLQKIADAHVKQVIEFYKDS